ncbi:Asp-tRNA(Asn)/Glu-tRNA(Gln) amidotransferase subunit GatB [bacterium]|nr:Asp-tRNA(Asn)/Glu-tRNA(Gln) amidotransferase subunit GatB [bacterium]
MNNSYEITIGLEIHAQLLTHSKAFCFAPSEFAATENTMVGPVSAGLPGALPVLNLRAVELAVRAGHCLNCTINSKSVFSRKNYFYPDLPKGYQISQFDLPLCSNGWIEIEFGQNQKKRINIERIHMEEDAGKSTHFGSNSLLNLNRSGVPLIEIVTKPEITSSEEAVAFMKKVHSILTFAKVSDGNMEEGNFRCDVNLSVKPVGEKILGTRTEIKNINSFRFAEKAIAYEASRQIALIQNGQRVIQETRGWDAALDKTFSQRSKEEAHDYRYFPDPDLPPLVLTPHFIEQIIKDTPELPEAKKNRLAAKYRLSEYDASLLTSSSEVANYFEECISQGAPAKPAANWILGDLFSHLKLREELSIERSPIAPKALAELISLIETKVISGKIAKTVFSEMFNSGETASRIVKAKRLSQVSDSSQIQNWVNEVLQKNPEVVTQFQQGQSKVFAFLVGQVMKLSQGKADPEQVSVLLKKGIAP